EFGAYQINGKALSIHSNLYDLFGQLKGELAIEGTALTLPQVEFSTIELKSTFEPDHSPFILAIKGKWKDSMELLAKGSFLKKENSIWMEIQDLDGFAFKKPFSLQEPLSLQWGQNHFKLDHFFLNIADGTLSSRMEFGKGSSSIKIKATDFPLEFIHL